jgi:hypothetical protein
MSMSSLAARREEKAGAGPGEDPAAGAAGEAFAALASAARRIRALARAGGELPAQMIDAELAGLAQATRAAEDLASRVIDTNRIAKPAYAAGYAAGAASRCLRIAR